VGLKVKDVEEMQRHAYHACNKSPTGLQIIDSRKKEVFMGDEEDL